LSGRLAVSKPGCGFSGITNYFIELFNYLDSEDSLFPLLNKAPRHKRQYIESAAGRAIHD
jgi:hypothetical protein